ncbi:MAG: hypothetical protein KKA62_01750 [Nanoarchaeota archaeon]|nr:hypothetical protein [Nanoarchaeota archaeon]MBU1976657.1 hypothetical protein [Nanoarchaeota archaeon]
MEDPGEHLVGQYLKEIKNCDFVEFNLQTKKVQGEIDVVGINSSDKIVYICEVATHLGGLQYVKNNQPDNVGRFIKKFEKDINYANNNFINFKKVFMLWTPIIIKPKKETKHNQWRDLENIEKHFKKKYNIQLEIIYNEGYYECINQLRTVAKNTTYAMTSPIMRFLQIEEKLKKITKNRNQIPPSVMQI